MSEGTAEHVVGRGDALDRAQEIRDLRAWRADVLHARHAEALERAEGHAPDLAQPVRFHRIGGTDDAGGARIGAAGLGAGQLVIGCDAGPVGLHEQEPGGRPVQAEAVPVVDGRDRDPVHELERAWFQPGAGHRGHGVAGSVERREESEHRVLRWGSGSQPERRLGHDPEGALRPDEEVGQRVARHVLDVATPGADDPAVRQRHLERQHRVAGHAVLHAAQPAGIRADVAADAADLVRGGVRGVEEPLGGGGCLEVGVDDSGLDDRDEVVAVDLENPIHPGEHDRQGALHPRRPAR